MANFLFLDFNFYVMRKLLILSIAMGLFGLVAHSQSKTKLSKVKLTEKVTVYVPKKFTPMEEGDIQQRYQSHRKPLALYTDDERLVDFGVNRSFSIWQESDIELLRAFYEASILELYDKVEFYDQGVKIINGHEFAFFEFHSVVMPETSFQKSVHKYTYLMYALSGGTTYVFNFSCPYSREAEWKQIAHSMMAAIKVK